jgi:hypothetical protein
MGRLQANGNAGAFAAAVALAAGACSHDWDTLDPRLSGAGADGVGAVANGGGGGAAIGGAGTAGSGASGAGGDGSGGGAAGGAGATGVSLSDDGLVVRYYLDEASSGIAPSAALDSASGALPLPIDYVGQMAYATEQGHLGIHWAVAAEDGGPALPISGTKLMDLDGSSAGTIEVVARVEQASVSGSRLLHIGEDTDWSFSLGVLLPQPDPRTVVGAPTRFVAEGALEAGVYYAVRWEHDFDPAERFVVHTVFDSNRANPSDRASLYLNGVLLPASSGATYPELGDTLALTGAEAAAIGNRLIGGRSIRGTIFYAAYYGAALTERTILDHVAVLTANDDTP